jgi:hypothetical protein
MKRYRIFVYDFDSRAHFLEPIQEHWEDKIKEQHLQNQNSTIAGLAEQYGERNIEIKVENFKDLNYKPLSVSAFHNKFLDQIRDSYVMGSYYPALTAACSLGERILNHLILLLRDYHKNSPEYKKIYRKKSFDYWHDPIKALESWGELLPEAANKFMALSEKRNFAIHFNPEVDHNDKQLALEAIHIIQDIVNIQFSAFGSQPWYFCVPGEMYIKKSWENKPFVKHVIIPNTLQVGPCHRIEEMLPKILVNDNFKYEDKEITDEEFMKLRQLN